MERKDFDGKEKIYEDLAVENSSLFTFNNLSLIESCVIILVRLNIIANQVSSLSFFFCCIFSLQQQRITLEVTILCPIRFLIF